MEQGIIYTRVSSEDQVTGTSLDFQESICRRYCDERRISVSAVFREEGESAKTADRTELLRALEFCRKQRGHIHAFIVAKVDRFARNTEDHFYVRKLLLEHGVTLHSVTEPIGNRPTEKFVETVLAASAEFDNAIRKQRCTDGMVARISQGIWPFRPPLGYVCARHHTRGEKKNRPDEPDHDLFPVIRDCLRVYAAGQISSLSQLGQLLDAKGLSGLRGRHTTPQLVDRLTRKYLDFFSGVLINPWTGERHQGLHQPMITEDESRRIRLYRSGRHPALRAKRDRFNPEFPLRRTVHCICGRPLTGAFTRGNGGRYPYYLCANKACPHRSKSIARTELHSAFFNLLRKVTPKERVLGLFETRFTEAWAKRAEVSRKIHTQRAQAIAELDSRRRRIFEMREDGSYTREMFHERLEDVDRSLALAQSETDEMLSGSTLALEPALAALRQLCRNLCDAWFRIPPSARPRFEHLVFPEGVTYDRNRGIRTGKLGLIFELNQQMKGSNSHKVHLRGISSNQWLEYLSEVQELGQELNAVLTSSTSRQYAAA